MMKGFVFVTVASLKLVGNVDAVRWSCPHSEGSLGTRNFRRMHIRLDVNVTGGALLVRARKEP